MKRTTTLNFVLTALVGAGSSLQAQSAPEYRGDYEGTGRACAGKLRVGAARLEWSTPFSHCGPSAYRAVDRSSAANGLEVEFQLLEPGKACRYPFLVLTHAAGAQPEIGWNVSGYPNASALNARKQAEALNCYLVK